VSLWLDLSRQEARVVGFGVTSTVLLGAPSSLEDRVARFDGIAQAFSCGVMISRFEVMGAQVTGVTIESEEACARVRGGEEVVQCSRK